MSRPVSAPPDPLVPLLFDRSPVPLGVIDIALEQFLRVNAAAERLFGYAPGTMAGLAAREILSPALQERLLHFVQSSATGDPSFGTLPMRTREGVYIWCDVGIERITADGQDVLLVSAIDATERLEAEVALERSERLFRFGFDHATVPTAILDAAGRFVRVNPAFARLVGQQPHDLFGRALGELTSEADAAAMRAILSCLKQRRLLDPPIELRLRHSDGHEAWTRIAVAPLEPTDGDDATFLAEIVDHSELRDTLDALKRSEERLALALDATNDGLWDWDLATGRLVVNSQWSRMLGYEPQELEPTIATWQRLSHPDDVPEAYAQLDAHAKGLRGSVDLEMRMRHKAGRWLWIRNRAKIVTRHADGSPQRVVGTHTDIDAQKAQADALQQQALLLDSVLSNIPIAIDIFSPTGEILYVNQHLEQLLGWTLREMQAMDIMAEVYPDPVYRQQVIASLIEGSPVWRDWELRARDGRQLTMTWSNVRLPDGRTIGMGTDVTALRAAEATEARLAQEMQQAQKLESLGLLAGGIAHDFNNLLVGVLGNASLAEELLPPDAEATPLVTAVREAASRAADLTRQLLAYAGKGRFVVEPIDLNVLVAEMASLLRAAVNRRITLHQQLTPELPLVEADATQLRQVIMNLITNASDALGDREGTITLRTELRVPSEHDRQRLVGGIPMPPGRYVCLTVSDTGEGMSADTMARIFDPFFTTKPHGHGLGLAATLGIVRSHRGGIAVDSVLGGGTTMSLYLPSLGAVRAPEEKVRATVSSATRSEGTILVADDEDTVRTVSTRALERAGFTVVACTDGLEAIRLFEATPEVFDGVVLDLTMPNLGGQDALLAIRAIRPDVPALLCSGYTNEELSPELQRLADIGFVQKPFTASQLVDALLAVVDSRS